MNPKVSNKLYKIILDVFSLKSRKKSTVLLNNLLKVQAIPIRSEK